MDSIDIAVADVPRDAEIRHVGSIKGDLTSLDKAIRNSSVAPSHRPSPTRPTPEAAQSSATFTGSRPSTPIAAPAPVAARGSFPAAAELVWNTALTQAAVAHSDDMVAGNLFSHTGYAWRGVAENIAAGQPTMAVVVDGWMTSDGHCANLMNATYRDIGVACVSGNANTSYRTYWTQDFGTAR